MIGCEVREELAFPCEGKGDRNAVDEVSFYEDEVLLGAVILNWETVHLLPLM